MPTRAGLCNLRAMLNLGVLQQSPVRQARAHSYALLAYALLTQAFRPKKPD